MQLTSKSLSLSALWKVKLCKWKKAHYTICKRFKSAQILIYITYLLNVLPEYLSLDFIWNLGLLNYLIYKKHCCILYIGAYSGNSNTRQVQYSNWESVSHCWKFVIQVLSWILVCKLFILSVFRWCWTFLVQYLSHNLNNRPKMSKNVWKWNYGK